jgi:hypothetical protein
MGDRLPVFQIVGNTIPTFAFICDGKKVHSQTETSRAPVVPRCRPEHDQCASSIPSES